MGGGKHALVVGSFTDLVPKDLQDPRSRDLVGQLRRVVLWQNISWEHCGGAEPVRTPPHWTGPAGAEEDLLLPFLAWTDRDERRAAVSAMEPGPRRKTPERRRAWRRILPGCLENTSSDLQEEEQQRSENLQRSPESLLFLRAEESGLVYPHPPYQPPLSGLASFKGPAAPPDQETSAPASQAAPAGVLLGFPALSLTAVPRGRSSSSRTEPVPPGGSRARPSPRASSCGGRCSQSAAAAAREQMFPALTRAAACSDTNF